MIYVADIAILMSNFDYFTITKYNENLLSNNTDDAESPKWNLFMDHPIPHYFLFLKRHRGDFLDSPR